MFDQLDSINWESLSHANGPAGDLPELIRGLAVNDSAGQTDALWALSEAIWDDGVIFEATSYVVPFLLEVLDSDGFEAKSDLLRLLIHIAMGVPPLVAQYYDSPDSVAIGEPDVQRRLADEHSWQDSVRQATSAGFESYLRALEADDSELRTAAAYMMPACLAQSDKAIGRLRMFLPLEDEEIVTATMLLAFGLIGEDTPEVIRSINDVVDDSEEDLIRLAGAFSLAILLRERLPERVFLTLLDLTEASTEALSTLDEHHRDWVELAHGPLVLLLAGLNNDHQARMIPSLASSMAYIEDSLPTAGLLLEFAFHGIPMEPETMIHDLNQLQRTALNAIALFDSAWHHEETMSQWLAELGLRGNVTRSVLSDFAGGKRGA